MPEPADLLGGVERVIRDLRGALNAGVQTDIGKAMIALVQRQTELMESVLERQQRFEEDLVGVVLAPVNVVVDVVEQSAAAMRTQAKALEAAAESLQQVSDLLDVQAGLLEGTARSMRDPLGALRSGAGGVARRAVPKAPPVREDGGE